ncbi:hypothetical protein HWV62_37083 [Athelia sp. TMB]|nr:hypothetical protein HWV62_37083 [Athelia sp. TMB]
MLPLHSKTNPTRRPLLLVAVAGAAIILLSAAGLSSTRTYTLTWADAEPGSASIGNATNAHVDFDYVVFPTSSPAGSYSQYSTYTQILPDWCIDAHFALGHTCAPGYYGNELPRGQDAFDLVWTWVNSSDPRLRDAMDAARLEDGLEAEEATTDKLFRDHDELRHSFRSVLRHFRSYIRSLTLFTSDFPAGDADYEVIQEILDAYGDGTPEMDVEYSDLGNSQLRLGLRPSWLRPNARAWRDGDAELGLQFQSEVFESYAGTSFNSIYLNDDFYMMWDLTPADFHTGAMGTVLRLDSYLLVAPSPDPTLITAAGEWGPLFASNALLSARFGWRGRPYTQHVPKALSRALLDEVHDIWGSEMRRTGMHRFRGMGLGAGEEGGDAYGVFLTVHLGVERWREALLWAFVVGRIGGEGDTWGKPERTRAWRDVGGEDGVGELHVKLTRRRSTDVGRVKGVMRKAGHAWSDRTHYAFSSEDGYPYTFPGQNDDGAGWPLFSGQALGNELCVLPAACFAGGSASAVFKRVAFEEAVACGDCIIHALRAQSGEYGLSAFLPEPEHIVTLDKDQYTTKSAPIPRLPLQREGDFRLESVLADRTQGGEVNVRSWTLRLLERYRFVIGASLSLDVVNLADEAMVDCRRLGYGATDDSDAAGCERPPISVDEH